MTQTLLCLMDSTFLLLYSTEYADNLKNHRQIGVGCMQSQEPLTVEEVAKQLRVSAETVRMWIRTGELDAIDVGKYLIYPADLEAFKERRRTGRKRNPENKEP